MSVLQIDAINTVIRSHYMPLFSRHGNYDKSQLDEWAFNPDGVHNGKRRYFEYWGHECSILPLELYPLFQWRMNEARQGLGLYKQLHSLAQAKPELINNIKREIEQRGPLTCREFAGAKRGKGMWQWSETKQALEYLFWTGDLASAGRTGFQRLYDCKTRVIPPALLNQSATCKLEAQSALLKISLAALGVASAAELRDYFRFNARDTNNCIDMLVEDNQFIPIAVEGWKNTAYIAPDTTIPRTIRASTLLTPFDPIVWHRERTERLFSFKYRVEIYVPESLRKFGYYVMPFLLDDRLVARVDVKADRNMNELVIKGAWPEAGVDKAEISRQLGAALTNIAVWLELDNIRVGNRGELCRYLKPQCKKWPISTNRVEI